MKREPALSHINDVLFAFCRHAFNIMDSWIPYPCTCVAEQLGISLYSARKCARKLMEDGLIVRDCTVVDPEESMLPYNGFNITEKAKSTDLYKRAAKEEADICSEVFGGTHEEWERFFAICP